MKKRLVSVSESYCDRRIRKIQNLEDVEIELERREEAMKEIDNVAVRRTMYQSFCDRICRGL